MSRTVNVEPDSLQENILFGEDDPKQIWWQSGVNDEGVVIIKSQIDEDMHDLETFTARVKAEDAKLTERSRVILELKAELEVLKKTFEETSRQLMIEHDAQESLETLSQGFTGRISSSMCGTSLPEIRASTDNALPLISPTITSLRGASKRCLASISELQGRLRNECMCLRLVTDRKESLGRVCGDLLDSIKSKRLKLSSKALPTEILLQVFDVAVEEFICEALNAYSTGRHPALNIALVCQRWHNIAMATPRLWQYVPARQAASPGEQLPVELALKRAKQSKNLFLDLISNMRGMDVDQLRSWWKTMGSFVHFLEDMDAGGTPTIIRIHYRGEPIHLPILFKTVGSYMFYNIYPTFLPSDASVVTSLVLHFQSPPHLSVLVAMLQILRHLIHFEVQLQGMITGNVHDWDYASCPTLECLAVRLSMLPLFFSGKRSVSRGLKSLTVHADTPDRPSFLGDTTWRFTVESGGLATSLKYLALEGGHSISCTSQFMVPLLSGFQAVCTLALGGPFMAPILENLSIDRTLLPLLYRLEMRGTDIDQTLVQEFLDSRREPQEDAHAPMPIRELVLDRCSSITRDFCDHIRAKVERLVIYC